MKKILDKRISKTFLFSKHIDSFLRYKVECENIIAHYFSKKIQ